jgi:hypothetical protein
LLLGGTMFLGEDGFCRSSRFSVSEARTLARYRKHAEAQYRSTQNLD